VPPFFQWVAPKTPPPNPALRITHTPCVQKPNCPQANHRLATTINTINTAESEAEKRKAKQKHSKSKVKQSSKQTGQSKTNAAAAELPFAHFKLHLTPHLGIHFHPYPSRTLAFHGGQKIKRKTLLSKIKFTSSNNLKGWRYTEVLNTLKIKLYKILVLTSL